MSGYRILDCSNTSIVGSYPDRVETLGWAHPIVHEVLRNVCRILSLAMYFWISTAQMFPQTEEKLQCFCPGYSIVKCLTWCMVLFPEVLGPMEISDFEKSLLIGPAVVRYLWWPDSSGSVPHRIISTEGKKIESSSIYTRSGSMRLMPKCACYWPREDVGHSVCDKWRQSLDGRDTHDHHCLTDDLQHQMISACTYPYYRRLTLCVVLWMVSAIRKCELFWFPV